MIHNSSILIIGAGQIGRSACFEMLKRKPKKLILHTLTHEESQESLDWVKGNCKDCDTELIASSGDVLIAFPGSDEASVTAEINYRFGRFTSEVWKSSPLWKLIETHKPDMIVDGINTATVVGYGRDPYTASRELHKIVNSDSSADMEAIKHAAKNNLLSEAVPQLIRFTQVLHLAMIEFNVKRYVKISTSGLGGMGFNLKYTHGDIHEPGCSPKLLGKVAATGILNQLLWTLSHTPGLDIKMIIPTTLVGWEGLTTDLTSRSGKSVTKIPLVDCESPVDLTDGSVFASHRPILLNKQLSMVAVDSGENGYYAIGDMTAITTIGQMGAITKEEVGRAVVESLEGSTRYDICTALDSVCIGPSYNAAFERYLVLDKMMKMEQEHKTRSVALGNLGPSVTKFLWELDILRTVSPSIRSIVESDPTELSSLAESLLLNEDPHLRRQILSVRMPILLENERILLGSSWHFPKEKNPDMTTENIQKWAQEGWVDVRASRMAHWQAELKQIIDFSAMSAKSPQVVLNRNWKFVDLDGDFNIGELLGLIYSINGGDRDI